MSDTIPQNTPQKQCTQCGKLVPSTTEFYHVNKASKDGLSPRCKACIREYGKRYRQEHKAELAAKKKQEYWQHRDRYREYGKRYRQEHKTELDAKSKLHYQEHRAYIVVYKQQYYQAHKFHYAELQKQYYKEHRDYCLERNKRYYQKHKLRFAELNRCHRRKHISLYREYQKKYLQTERGCLTNRANVIKRRARKKSADGFCTSAQLLDQKKRQLSKCYYCSTKLGKIYHVDHIVPLSKDGSNDISNIVLTCPSCNLKKGSKLLHEWPEGRRLI